MRDLGSASENLTKKSTRLGNESTNTARAFAAQSSGLGGLVAAYAGAAATTFALQQGFSALQSVANFEQTIAGTNALAASFGQSGEQVIKTIQGITKGQLSIKQAAETANIALAAGFNVSQIAQINEVATKASKALGRDLTDSINRLSRGVAKLEPELLDELGIFTRIEPAVEAYAAKIGRSVSSLTNFERRQAFLNATIDEGSRKYAEINLSTDTSAESLNRLLASLSDIANRLGSFLTDVLAPIADFFSKSLGNSITLFLGVLALALSKGRGLLEVFFSQLSEGAARLGSNLAAKFSGPEATQAFERAGAALSNATLKGLSATEKTYVGKIVTGDLLAYEIPKATQALQGIVTRGAEGKGLGGVALQGKQLDELRVNANAAAVALTELEVAKNKSSVASTRLGGALGALSAGLQRVSGGIAIALAGFNKFLAILTAVQFGVQLFTGFDILGSVFEFFENIRKEAKDATDAVSALIQELSKNAIITLKFQLKPEELKEAITAAADTLKKILSPGIFDFRSIEQRFKDNLDSLNKDAANALTERGRNLAAAQREILKEIEASGILNDRLTALVVTQAPREVGGQAEDFAKLYTSGILKQGAVDFGGAVTQVLDTNDKIDKLTGKIALNVALGVREVEKFNEEQAKGLLTAESASQRNIALGQRLEEIESQILETRLKVNREAESAAGQAALVNLNNLETQRQALEVQKEILANITKELTERERIRKLIKETFSSQIKSVENLPTSGLISPDGTVARTQNEIQRNQLLFLGDRSRFLEKEIVSQKEILGIAVRREAIAKDTVAMLSQRRSTAAEQAAARKALADATIARKTEESKLGTIENEQKEAIFAQIGFLKQAGEQAYNISKQEEKRSIEYRKQLELLKNEAEVIALQNKLNLVRASSEASQRIEQAKINTLEAQLQYQKAIQQTVEAILASRNQELDILNREADAQLKLADAQSKLEEARVGLRSSRQLGILELQKDAMSSAESLFTREDIISKEIQIAETTYKRDIEVLAIRERQLVKEYALEDQKRLREIEKVQNDIAALNGTKVNLDNQRKLEDEIAKRKNDLETSRLKGELAQLGIQKDLLKAREKIELDNARSAKEARDFELNLVSVQLDLLEQQAKVFEEFLKKYEELLKKQFPELGNRPSETIFKTFREDLAKARLGLTSNQALSGQILTQTEENIRERFRGEAQVIGVQAGAAARALSELQKKIAIEEETRLQQRAAEDQKDFDRAKFLESQLKNLESERAAAALDYETKLIELAKQRQDAEIAYASAIQKSRNALNDVRGLFIDIAKAINDNLSKAVLDLFKTLNKPRVDSQGNEVKTSSILRGAAKGFAVGALEDIQAAIATRFIIRPFQNLVSKGIGAIYEGVFGEKLQPETTEDILKAVYKDGALSVRVINGTTGKEFTYTGEGTGSATAGAFGKTQEEAKGFTEKLQDLGVNFKTVGSVAASTFITVLSLTRDWKKAFIYAIGSALTTALSQVAMAQVTGSTGSAAASAGSSFLGSFGKLFGFGNKTIPDVGRGTGSSIDPQGMMPGEPIAILGSALGGSVKQMAIGGPAVSGLRDRVPALLEPGEFVIRRPSAMAIGGDTLGHMNATGQVPSNNVMVNVNNQGTAQEPVGKPVVSRQGEQLIIDIVLRDMQNNGPIRKSMRNMK